MSGTSPKQPDSLMGEEYQHTLTTYGSYFSNTNVLTIEGKEAQMH